MAKTDEQRTDFCPDVFIVPSQVMLDPNLQALDTKVYATIYWLEHLKDGRCFASNATLAKIAGSSSNGVNNSLNRLRKHGYIHCQYDDNNHRTGITSLVQMRKGTSNKVGGVPEMSNIDNNTKKVISCTESERAQATELHTGYVKLFKLDQDDYRLSSKEQQTQMLASALAKYKLTDDRLAKILPRLRDAGFAMCKKAIINANKSDWNHGQNPSGWKMDLYKYLFRSYEQVEDWANRE